MVQEALDKVMAGRTALIIAHRLTTVEKCNRLAVIADGIVAEEGSYDQLLNKEGGSFNMIAKGLNEEKKWKAIWITVPKEINKRINLTSKLKFKMVAKTTTYKI